MPRAHPWLGIGNEQVIHVGDITFTSVPATLCPEMLNVAVAPDWNPVPARLVIATVVPLEPVFGVIPVTVGAGLVTVIYPTRVAVLLPPALVAVRLTVYVPAVVYWCEGFWSADEPVSPKFHAHEVGLLAEVSVNVTVSGAVPDVGVPVKLATGGGVVTVM